MGNVLTCNGSVGNVCMCNGSVCLSVHWFVSLQDLNEKNDSTDVIRIPLEAVIREELLSPGVKRSVSLLP